jgi:ankyrin repeat protein
LRRITERNDDGKTAFDIAIEKGQLKCIKQFLLSSWLVANIDVRELINADSLRNAVDENQLDILAFFVTDAQRFAYIIHLLINVQERYFNLVNSIFSTQTNKYEFPFFVLA